MVRRLAIFDELMKNISTILSFLSLIGVGVLFYLHFSAPKPAPSPFVRETGSDTGRFRIAYFDIDSLQRKYEYFRDVTDQIKSKEASVSAQLNSLQNTYQKRIKELQEKAPTMTQAEGESAQREYGEMQQKFQQRQKSLEQDLEKHQIDMMTDVRGKIEKFLQEYNRDKGYAFILSYEPGFMVYYKDTVYDITREVIEGLNRQYKKEKEKK